MKVINVIADSVLCNIVEKNLVPKSQTKPFYIGTKEAPSDISLLLKIVMILTSHLTIVNNSFNIPCFTIFILLHV